MTLRQKLSYILGDAFEKCGYGRTYGLVTVSNRPDLCQFQCNGAMAAAKQYKKAPIAIAGEIAAKLNGHEVFALIEAVPPGFININITDNALTEMMNGMSADARLLLPAMDKRVIVMDYGGANVAKPLHVGHLRSAILGESMRRLALFLGHEVISDVHLGDWGLQMGLVMASIEEEQPQLVYFDKGYTGQYPKEPPVTLDDLNVIYPAASARSKTDAEFAAKAAQITVELQDLRPGYYALWKQIWNVSVADLEKNYTALGVHFDKWLGESDSEKYIPQVIEILTERGLLIESEGAKVVEVALPDDKEPMPPMLIVKSNGGDIYGTTDLGTILQRMQDWKPDEIWYFTDTRQSLHFKQVFRCAALAGFLGDTQCFHVNNGTVNGKDGKPYKTREGGVMRLSDMIQTVTENAYQKISEAVSDDAERAETAKMVGVAAMKIGDMINHRAKDYIFDMERFLASEGKTGPYLQYTAVRIQSVLKKARAAKERFGLILPPEAAVERELMLSLTCVSETLLRAFEEKAPNMFCEALFGIAWVFNRFYFENRILTCEDEERRASWLSLLELTGRMIDRLLDIIGIEVPERM